MSRWNKKKGGNTTAMNGEERWEQRTQTKGSERMGEEEEGIRIETRCGRNEGRR